MTSKDLAPEDDEKNITVSMSKGEAINKRKAKNSPHVVTAESVQAEEVPTIPLGSLQTLSTLQPEVSIHALNSISSMAVPAPLVAQQSEYHRGIGEWLQIWWDGIRPGYLPLSLLPIVLGSVLAWTQSISVSTPRGTFHP